MTRKKSEDEKEIAKLSHSIREVMKTPHGKDFIWAILEECNIYSDVFTGDASAFYLEGTRKVGLRILDMLEAADPTCYPRLLLDKLGHKSEEDYERRNDYDYD